MYMVIYINILANSTCNVLTKNLVILFCNLFPVYCFEEFNNNIWYDGDNGWWNGDKYRQWIV